MDSDGSFTCKDEGGIVLLRRAFWVWFVNSHDCIIYMSVILRLQLLDACNPNFDVKNDVIQTPVSCSNSLLTPLEH